MAARSEPFFLFCPDCCLNVVSVIVGTFLGKRGLLALHFFSLWLVFCLCLFALHFGVCVSADVLRLSQPNRVMSSSVSLPNHTFSWAGLVL